MKNKDIASLLLLQFVFLLIAGCISIFLGQDANWDLKNYHLYNAWSFLNERHLVDVAAAGLQTYFSPFLDIPYFYLSTQWLSENPKLVAFLFGFPYGIVLLGVFIILKLAFEEMGLTGFVKYACIVVYGFIGVTGVASISQIGTTFNEMHVAAFVVAAVALSSWAIKNINRVTESKSLRHFFIAGLLVGVAGGLKLTAVIYSVALIISLTLISKNLHLKSKILIASFIGCSIGFLFLYSPWAVFLYTEYGNPVFPMFNSIFRSEWSDMASGVDDRFLPKSLKEYFLYPFYWADSERMTVMEPRFSDWRFAAAFSALLFIAAQRIIKNFFTYNTRPITQLNEIPLSRFIIAFIVFSYAIWLSLFSILRYAIVIEVLSGIIIALGAFLIATLFSPKRRSAWLLAIGILFATFFANTTKYPDWGRVDFSKKVFSVSHEPIPKGSLVILINKPLAFYAPFLAENTLDVSFLGYSDKVISAPKSKLHENFESRILSSQGAIYALVRPDALGQIEDLRALGLLKEEKCSPVKSNIDSDVFLCKLRKELSK